MRITAFLLLFSVIQVMGESSYSQNTRLSLNFKDVSIENVLDEIENQSEFYFLFNQKLVDVNRKVDIDAKNKRISDILSDIFVDEDINCLVMDRQILLSPKYITKTVNVTRDRQPQEIVITGKVTDDTGQPLPGVTVVVKGTMQGTVTNADGTYTIASIPDDATLVFSFVGMLTKEVVVGNQTSINITMAVDAIGIEEVVAIGYGTLKKTDLTGSVGSIRQDELKELGVTHMDQGLVGRLAGVQVKNHTGMPGHSQQIRIRGVGSITASVEPLYVVDGFPVEDIQMLNPNNIQTIDILKDASATAIYGSRGANGVILITTNRGKNQKAEITYNASFGLQQVSHIPGVMNAQEQAEYGWWATYHRNEDAGFSTEGIEAIDWRYPLPVSAYNVLQGRKTTDIVMVEEIMRIAPHTIHQLSATGGTEDIKYMISGEYNNQQGIVIETDFKRYSIRANLDANITDKLSISANLNQAYTDQAMMNEASEGSYGGWISDSPVTKAMLWMGYFPAYSKNADAVDLEGGYIAGDYFMFDHDQGAQVWNPIAELKEVQDRQKRSRFLGNLHAKYQLADAWLIDIMFGSTIRNQDRMRFEPEHPALAGGGSWNIARGRNWTNSSLNWISENMLHYNKTFGRHSIIGVAGYTIQKNRYESSYMFADTYPNNLVPTLNASGTIGYGNTNISEWSLVSYLARIKYKWANKYYLTASFRTDGSSRFGREDKYGNFPSAALAYRISEEDFMKDINTLSDLKLRVSVGRTGNNSIGNYQHLALIRYGAYTLGNSRVDGYSPASLPNDNLTWETQEQINFGLDAGIFDNRISLTLEYFKSINKDLLLNVNIPATSGFTSYLRNIGKVQNTGWEFQIKTVNAQGKFSWTTDFNISQYTNEVLELGPEGDPIIAGAGGITSGANITMIGKPIGMFYGYLTDGVFMNEEELAAGPRYGVGSGSESRVGDLRFVDLNDDGEITSADQGIMGTPYPDFNFGMTNSFRYENFSLNVSFYGSYGNEIINMGAVGQMNLRGARVLQRDVQLNHFKTVDDPGNGIEPRPNDQSKGGNRNMCQRFLDDGTFLRISNINLGYDFSNALVQKMGLNSLRIYLSSNNPVTFMKSKLAFNPDVSNSRNALTPGVDFNDYPLPRTLTLGVNVSF